MASPSRLPSRRPAAGGRSRPVSMIEGSMLNLNLAPPQENGTPSKQAKRRSLLPQFARKGSGEATIKEDEEHVEAVSTVESIPNEPRKAMEEADRRAMPPPSRLSRPTSVYGAGMGLGRATSVRTHTREASKGKDARADALAALTGGPPSSAAPKTAADSGLKRGASTRLPQGPATRGLSRTTSVKAKDPPPRTSSIASKPTPVAEKRSSVTKARPTSIHGSAHARPPSITSPPSPSSSTTSRQSSTRPQSQLLPPSRPSFSTYQQHYSPAKSALPKPPLPFLQQSKPAATEEEPPSFDVVKQQVELLQLSLMHQTSRQTMQEYEASAKRKLARKQAKLRKEYEAIRAQELEQQRLANLTALDAWCPDVALLGEHLHVLVKAHSELSTFTEDESSRYSHLVSVFEQWIDGAEATLSGKPAAGFIEVLPQDWHKAHTSLALRLRALQRDLGMLPPPPSRGADQPQSSLEVLLKTCTTMLDGMLKELEMMSKLERELLQREKIRVQEEVKVLTQDDSASGLDVKGPWVPAWQSVA